MRHRYLVAYDVCEPKRLRRTFKTLNGFGDPLQYSVFQCSLSDVEKEKMVEAVSEVIKHDEDRVLILDIGPAEGRARTAFQYLGVRPAAGDVERVAVIV